MRLTREMLEALGMSQKQAAHLFGVNDRTIRRYLSGSLETPLPIIIIIRLMEHFNLGASEVLMIASRQFKKRGRQVAGPRP